MQVIHILSLHIIVFKHPIPCGKLCICRTGGKIVSVQNCVQQNSSWLVTNVRFFYLNTSLKDPAPLFIAY